jgi:hypothetical protein
MTIAGIILLTFLGIGAYLRAKVPTRDTFGHVSAKPFPKAGNRYR